MTITSKPDWQYVFTDKLRAPKVRRLMSQRGVIVDGPVEPQIEQISSAGFPSWSLYNLTRRYLLGSVSVSVCFAYLSYNGEYADLLASIRSYMSDTPVQEQAGSSIVRTIQEGAGPNTHIVVEFTYRVDKLGTDLSLARDQTINSVFKIKRIENNGYIIWCIPRTRFDYREMIELVGNAARFDHPTSQVLPYAPCPTRSISKHFPDAISANSFYLDLFSNGVIGLACEDVFKADTFEWSNGFEFLPRTGDEIVRDRAELIRRIRYEGAQLSLNSGRVNEIIGAGYAIHNFGATFQCQATRESDYSWQFPLEYKFVSRPLGGSINGGPLLYKLANGEWLEYPGSEITEGLLVHCLEHLLRVIHNRNSILLPGAIRTLGDIPLDAIA